MRGWMSPDGARLLSHQQACTSGRQATVPNCYSAVQVTPLRVRSANIPHANLSSDVARQTPLSRTLHDAFMARATVANGYLDDVDEDDEAVIGQARLVQWYPGHIAKAERRLREQLNMVDVVLEVRDARIPLSSTHPHVPKWCGNRPRLLVMNRVDMVREADRERWTRHYGAVGQPTFWTNGETGLGIGQVTKAATAISTEINSRRKARGLKPRPVRACVIGFPNVGKSALINRLLNRRLCDSAPKPGVTRDLKWLRIGGELDLLDAPGVIPASFNNQVAAERLAMCNDIGEAAYVDSLIAAALIEALRKHPHADTAMRKLITRYGFGLLPSMTGEDYVKALADDLFQGDLEKGGIRILKDFRLGNLGKMSLELPPPVTKK